MLNRMHGSRYRPTVREKRGWHALTGAYHAKLLELEGQVKSLEQELEASVRHLERLQCRAAAHERRLATAEETIRAHGRGIEGIFSGRLWRGMELAGRVQRRLFRAGA